LITKRSIFIIGAMLLAILFTDFGVFTASVISYESVEQERTLCIKECKDRYGIEVMRGAGRGGDSGMWRLYFKCMDDCEKKFWKEWQKDMDKLEKE